MPVAPFYVFQRINEPLTLSELDNNLDLDGDGAIDASNNIFQFDIGESGYTPAWYPILVRTVPDFVSIDTAGARGPIIATLRNPGHRNAIGTHAGGYSVYRALAITARGITRTASPP